MSSLGENQQLFPTKLQSECFSILNMLRNCGCGFEYNQLYSVFTTFQWCHNTHRAHSNPAYHNSTDLAIPPAQGFQPPKLSVPKDRNGAVKKSAQPSTRAAGREGSRGRMVTTRDLMAATATELVRQSIDNINRRWM